MSSQPRTGETDSERHTRQIAELLQETRVAAVGVQVITGFLLAVPFSADLQGLQRDTYVVTLLAAILGTGFFLAPSVLHRVLLHHGQAAWLVAVGSRLLLAGSAATSIALTAAAVMVGDRVLDGWVAVVPAVWTAGWLAVLWLLLPLGRRRRLGG
ncbi:DUF6328 family protein [Patulibacter defluvii]|uniref:DUF6328 family protein n=1 Tax=Patulibacter defluvii TaxID=3095358 RepID=UPI002A750DB6|nr:DUF6328 family protein [Patulibacter sp. DM4]